MALSWGRSASQQSECFVEIRLVVVPISRVEDLVSPFLKRLSETIDDCRPAFCDRRSELVAFARDFIDCLFQADLAFHPNGIEAIDQKKSVSYCFCCPGERKVG